MNNMYMNLIDPMANLPRDPIPAHLPNNPIDLHNNLPQVINMQNPYFPPQPAPVAAAPAAPNHGQQINAHIHLMGLHAEGFVQNAAGCMNGVLSYIGSAAQSGVQSLAGRVARICS